MPTRNQIIEDFAKRLEHSKPNKEQQDFDLSDTNEGPLITRSKMESVK